MFTHCREFCVLTKINQLFGSLDVFSYFCKQNNISLVIMPKVLLYITAKIIWIFLFYNKDFNENRAHVHVGKKDTQNLCKIWLEPNVELAKQGDLTDAQVKQVLQLAEQYKEKLINQWQSFKEGKTIRMIKIKK